MHTHIPGTSGSLPDPAQLPIHFQAECSGREQKTSLLGGLQMDYLCAYSSNSAPQSSKQINNWNPLPRFRLSHTLLDSHRSQALCHPQRPHCVESRGDSWLIASAFWKRIQGCCKVVFVFAIARPCLGGLWRGTLMCWRQGERPEPSA